MSIYKKRIIYGFFMAVFLAATPLLLLYVTGHRFNFKKNILEKTGVIFLETDPRDVTVSLNQKIVGTRTPLRLKNLKPNDYDFIITKEGFHSWTKTLPVFSGETTFAQFVRLFKKNPLPQIILAGEDLEIIPDLAINGGYYILQENLSGLEIHFFNSNTGKITSTGSLDIENYDQLVISDGRLLVKQGNRFTTYDLGNLEETIRLNNFIVSRAIEGRIDPDNSNFLWGKSANLLFRYNLSSGERNVVLDRRVLGFANEKNNLYVVKNSSNKNTQSLVRLDLNNLETEDVVAILPTKADGNYRILTELTGHILVLEEENQILYISEIGNRELNPTEIIPNVAGIVFNGDNNEFLYYNDLEIWHYSEGQKKLLTRLSSGVDEVVWYPVPTHLLFVGEDRKTLSVMETVESNSREKIDLVNLNSIKSPIVNNKGDIVYFIGQIGSQAGLFEVEIQ